MTLPRRQTACQMQHCCARRIVGTGSRRKLGCTSTRWAERHPQGVYRIRKAAKPPTAAQQRIVGAGANRIAMLNAASPRAGSAIGKHCSSSSCSLAMGNAFLLDGRRPFSFSGKKMGIASRGTCAALTFAPVRKRKNSLSRKRISPFPAFPARCGENPSPLKGYHLLPVNKKSDPRFSKTARNIRFANPSPHA